jgi:hypothetical protein
MEALRAMTDPLAGWLLFFGLPLILGGLLLRSFSAGRGVRWRLGREFMRLGLGCLVMAGFFYFGIPAIEEQLLKLPGAVGQ